MGHLLSKTYQLYYAFGPYLYLFITVLLCSSEGRLAHHFCTRGNFWEDHRAAEIASGWLLGGYTVTTPIHFPEVSFSSGLFLIVSISCEVRMCTVFKDSPRRVTLRAISRIYILNSS